MSAASPISLLSPERESPPPKGIKNRTDADAAEKENVLPYQPPDCVYSVTVTKEYPWYYQDTPDGYCVGTYLDLEDAKNEAWDRMSDKSHPPIDEQDNGGEIYLGRDPVWHYTGTSVQIEAVTVHKPGSVPWSKKRPQPEEKKGGKKSRKGKSPAGVKKAGTNGQKVKGRKRKEWELLAD